MDEGYLGVKNIKLEPEVKETEVNIIIYLIKKLCSILAASNVENNVISLQAKLILKWFKRLRDCEAFKYTVY